MRKIHGNSKYHKILTKAYLLKEYVEGKKSTTCIAKTIGCNRKTVYNCLRKYIISIRIGDVAPKGKNHYKFGENKHNITEKYLIEAYLINKKSMPQIAKELNCGKTMIEYYLKKYKIKIRTISESLKGEKSSIYIDGRCSKKYYCKHCGKNRISYHAYKYGLGYCKSCANKLKWQNKEYRNRMIRALRKGSLITPNKKEKLLNALLNELLPKEYKFVGDWKFVIDGFCPDFVNVNGQKKIIEFYGDYWHNKLEVKERDKRRLIAYKKYGYKTLIIWQRELKDLEKVKDKILNFNGGIK